LGGCLAFLLRSLTKTRLVHAKHRPCATKDRTRHASVESGSRGAQPESWQWNIADLHDYVVHIALRYGLPNKDGGCLRDGQSLCVSVKDIANIIGNSGYVAGPLAKLTIWGHYFVLQFAGTEGNLFFDYGLGTTTHIRPVGGRERVEEARAFDLKAPDQSWAFELQELASQEESV